MSRTRSLTWLFLPFIGGAVTTTTLAAADTPTIPFGPGGAVSDSSIASQLPVTGSFTASFAFDETATNAALDVWPAEVSACGGPVPGGSSDQVYKLPIELTTTDGKTTGKTVVPHLQVGESFCFRTTWRALKEPDKDALERVVKQKIAVPPQNAAEAEQLANDLAAAVTSGFCHPKGVAAAGPECITPPLAPLARQLEQAGVPVHAAVSGLARDDETKKTFLAHRAELARNAAQFHPAAAIANKVPSAGWVAANGADPNAITAAKAFLDKNPHVPEHDEMVTWLTDWQETQGRIAAINVKLQKGADDLDSATSAAVIAQRDAAYAFFKTNLRAEKESVRTLTVTTTDFHNYFSPEIGMSAAAPFVKGGRLTLVPYTAVNVYFRPVERSLPLGKLLHPFTQRFSLTLGLALTKSLSATDVDLGATVANTYGLVGAGYRILPFARAAVLVMFADAKPTGGLTGDSKLVAAGALAISADLDAVAFITSTLKN